MLIANGVTPALAWKICNRYKTKTSLILESDPYQLAREVVGIGFVKADDIALKLGMSPFSPQRIKAGVFYALEKALEEGHTYLEVDMIEHRVEGLIGELPGGKASIPFALVSLCAEGFVKRFNVGYYALASATEAEEYIAEQIGRLSRLPFTAPSAHSRTRAAARVEKLAGFALSYEQLSAVDTILHQGLAILTGGPGCGKTTITRTIVAALLDDGQRVLLTAPTGRAAQRLGEVCGHPAATIHRLLRYNPGLQGFTHNEQNPVSADVVIVDEASMVDIFLMRDLLKALPPYCRLILVGDKDQLPSVGPGRVFADIITKMVNNVSFLSKTFRQVEGSDISRIAAEINEGKTPGVGAEGEAKILVAYTSEVVVDRILEIYQPGDCVLTPYNNGDLGTARLNNAIQAKFNPEKVDKAQLRRTGSTLRVGDRIVQRVNNYKLHEDGVFNGDIGTIIDIDPRGQATVLLADSREIEYENKFLWQLELGYVLTIHRSQGGEFGRVILVLHESHYPLLERQLIYTAVTRAKSELVIVGTRKALNMACGRCNASKRLTRLGELL